MHVPSFLSQGLFYRSVRNRGTVDYRALLRAWWRRRLAPRASTVGWLLCGDMNTGSSRIHGFNIDRELNHRGLSSYVVRRSRQYNERFDLDATAQRHILRARFDTIVFQRVHIGAESFVARLRQQGTRSVFLMADDYPTTMPSLCDHIIVVSDELRDVLVADGVPATRITVIPDPIETPQTLCKDYTNPGSRAKIKLVWVGNEGHWPVLDPLRALLSDEDMSGFELVTISSHPESTFQWRLETVWPQILDCDIAVVPANLSAREGRVKSNNRLTMFRALGLPVVCSPLPAYQQVAAMAGGVFFAETTDDWRRQLQLLRDVAARRDAGMAGRQSVLDNYGLAQVACQYAACLLPGESGLRT